MPKVGDEEFAYTPEGIEAAKQKAETTGVPMSNAMERSRTYQVGGKVLEYKEGGKLEDSKEEGYDYWTKQLKSEILDNYRTDDTNVTDLVKLRSRRQKEIEKAEKKGKKK